ncbi:MAG: hypothetical protein JOY77_12255 [Alphaproteobacteria bacterium]|nr:hypothetical protein [Alphaproteobacteria bacterium]
MLGSVKIVIAAAAVFAAAQTGAAADNCVRHRDMMALKVAALQQQLMVAALTCHAVPRYNQFVVGYRKQLFNSDNALKAFFIRRGSVAGYHAYKTKLANNASLTSIADMDSYCRAAFAAYDSAANAPSLAAFVDLQPAAVDGDFTSCAETRLAAREERRGRRRALAER